MDYSIHLCCFQFRSSRTYCRSRLSELLERVELVSYVEDVIILNALFCSFCSFWLRTTPMLPHTSLQ